MSQAFVTGGKTVNVGKSYKNSFGDLEDGTVYQDTMGVLTGQEGYDLRPGVAKAYEPYYKALDERMQDGESFRSASNEVAKALSTSDLTLPVYPRQDLVNVAMKRTPFYEMLPKMTAATKTVDQDSVTDLGQAEIGGESDIPSGDADDSFSPQSLAMSYWRIRGAVTGPMQLAASSLRNSMSGEQSRKSMSMRHLAENLVLNGDPTAADNSGTVTDERGFKGIRQLAVDNGRDITPAAGVGTTVTVEEVRRTMRLAGEDGGDLSSLVGLTDLKTLTDLKNEADDHHPLTLEGGNGRTINLGGRGMVIDDMPIVVSDFMPNTDGSREFATVDMRFHRFHNLSDMVMEALGKTKDADEFFLKQYGVMEQAAGASKYTSLLTSLA